MATQLGNMAVGSVVYLNENNSPVPYLIVNQGIPSSSYDASCNGTWLLRQECVAEITQWSNVNSYFSDTVLSSYSATVQNTIKTVKVPYCQFGTSNVKWGSQGYSCKLFSLSIYELGFLQSDDPNYIMVDGAKLAYFGRNDAAGNETRATGQVWWTRSVGRYYYNDYVLTISYYGQMSPSSLGPIANWGRPAMVMPTNLIVDDDGLISGETVPDPPSTITVPTQSIPAGSTISVSWDSVSGISSYTVQRSINGGSWQTVYTGANTNYSDTAQATWTQVQYQVSSVKSGFNSAYLTSSIVTVLPYTITSFSVPSLVMQGQNIPLSWSPVTSATTYVLERSVNSGGWTQIYSGSNTSYTDTPQSDWTTVQYQIKAGDGTVYGAYLASASIPVISASALVISGSDSDLGTLTADVPYTVTSDTGNPITLQRYVNNNLVATLTVESGFAYTVPVMELPTGSGTIEIQASVEAAAGGTVSATRTWTYVKTAATFSNSGGTSQLTQNGQNMLPLTIAECVRVPTFWGGSLDKALELLLPVVNSAVISVGTYEGTGTYGEESPNTLTFTDQPIVVTIYGAGQTLVISSTDTSSTAYLSGNQAIWYSTESASAQMNTDGVTYSYVAVGKQVQ